MYGINYFFRTESLQIKRIIRILRRFTLLLIILCTLKVYTQDWKTYPYQPSGSIVNFPEDEGFHFDESIEWMYINGHISGKNTGTEYSFMLAYFYTPAFGFDGFRIFNLADETSGQFYDESMPCIFDTIAEDSLNIKATVGLVTTHTEEWINLTDISGRMIPFQYHIKAESQAGSIDINCNTIKHPLIIADSGYLYQGKEDYTYYYSQTMIDISGLLSFNSTEDTISGTGWIEHQYGSFSPNNGEEYEWFCIQLDNGMDLNIWNIFTEDNRIPDKNNYRICSVYINDSSSFTTYDFNIERLKFEYTRDSLKCYSQEWNFLLDTFDIDLLISVNNSESEVILPFRFYEGSTVIEGTVNGLEVRGKGFAELLHSYDKPELSILYPDGNGIWEESESIEWKLINPDEGNPVLYNVEISYDRGNTFLNIAQAISDTSYYWDPSYFTEDTIINLILTAYSVDSTLIETSEVDLKYNPRPNDYMLCTGDSISLFISLGNKNEFEYQWQKDGAYISGAADSLYTLSYAETSDNGSYTCIIHSRLFTDTTISFDLIVNPDFETDIYRSICKNDSIYIGGKWQKSEGVYYDTLNSVFGCDSVLATILTIEVCNLNEDESFKDNFKVFPNPASESLFIEFDDYFTGNVEIINCYGEIIRTKFIKNCTEEVIDLSELTNGMYLLRLKNDRYQTSVKIMIINH
jgi:predicted secreted hydrolase